MADRVHLILCARSARSSPGAWTVDVLKDYNHEVASTCDLNDPLSKQQCRELKWYLEKYAQISPHSARQALDARETLQGYAASIIEQLDLKRHAIGNCPLSDKVDKDLLSGIHGLNPRKTTITIEIVEEDLQYEPTGTVHQLHWELLEDPSNWLPYAVDVVVKRSMRSTAERVSQLNRVSMWPKADHDLVPRVNILLVTARELTPNPATYKDISPSMTFRILSNIKSKLISERSPLKLNLEVVRPGTFRAFADHLARSESQRGPGYFQIVHFDMHGSVSLKRKRASLYFNSSRSDGTVAVPAQNVAKMLEKYHVPFVVLNACESARANCGDDANIARQFTVAGVKDVLAMSFKVSNSAAESFLAVFYQELLTNGASFGLAASHARECNRLSPLRDARFGLRLGIVDWFVPVTYTSSADSALVSSTKDRESLKHLQTSLAGPAPLPISRLYGRDFDLLCYEKMLLAERVVSVYGRAGVGKTALLKYACATWQHTSFADAVVYVDFSVEDINSTEDLANLILRELLMQIPECSQCTFWTIDSAQSHDEASKWQSVYDILGKYAVALVFDGVEFLEKPSNRLRWMAIGKAPDIDGFFKNLEALICLASGSTSQLQPIYLTFVSRKEISNMSNGMHHTFTSGVNAFKVRGLELAEAIEFSVSLLRGIGFKTEDWKTQEMGELEHVIKTLQAIPGCLVTFLPLCEPTRKAWISFHDSLLQGSIDLPKLERFQRQPVLWQDLEVVSTLVNADTFSSLMVLGSFWHDVPWDFDEFIEILKRHQVIGDEKSAELFFSLAISMDLVVLYESDIGGSVHPMFTLFTRGVFARHELKEQELGNATLDSVLALVDPTQKRLEEYPQQARFIVDYWRFVNSDFLHRTAMIAFTGIEYKDMDVKYGKKFRILLCAIRTCIEASEQLPLGSWPMELLYMSASNVRMICSTAEASLFSSRFEDLLNEFFKRVGGLAVPPEHRQFAFSIVIYLAATHRCEVSNPNCRSVEFVELGLNMLSATESEYGVIEDSHAIYLKGVLFRYKTLTAIGEADITNIRKYAKLSSQSDEQFLVAAEKEMKERSEGSHEVAPELMELWKSLTEKGTTIPKAYIGSRRHVFNQTNEMVISIIESGEKMNQSQLDVFDQWSFGLKHVHGALDTCGFTGLQAQRRWWPEDFDIVRHSQRSKVPLNRLREIDDAKDSGDVSRAAVEHKALLQKAVADGDIENIMEHVNAIDQLYASDPRFTEVLEEFKRHTCVLRAMADTFNSLFALGKSDHSGSAIGILQNVERLIGAAKVQGLSTSNIRILENAKELLGRELDRDGSSLTKFREDATARLRGHLKRGFRLAARHQDNLKYLKEMQEVLGQTSDLYRRIYDSESDGDFGTAVMHLEQMARLAETAPGNEVLDVDFIESHRQEDVMMMNWNTTVTSWGQNMMNNDYEGARVELKRLWDLVDVQPDKRVCVSELQSETEQSHLTFEKNKAREEREASNFAAAVARFDKLLTLFSTGSFSHISSIDNHELEKDLRLGRILTMAQKGMSESSWENEGKAWDEWLSLNEEKAKIDPRSVDHIRDLRETCEFHMHNNRLLQLDRECRYHEAQQHLDSLVSLYDRQRKSPEVKRTICPRMTKEALDGMTQMLSSQKAVIENLGPEGGKAFILACRDLNGHNYPFRLKLDWN